MAGLLITATDTGVGKTTVAAALVRSLRRLGLEVGAMKPAESGCGRDAFGALIAADAALLRAAAGGADTLELVCPYRLEAPLAPGIAAAQEGRAIDWGVIERCLSELRRRHPDGVVVEGAGGIMVPMAADYGRGFGTVADLALRLRLPALVVARGGLGTINHTVLTLQGLEARSIACRGVLLSPASPAEARAAKENARAIERLTGVPVLASLPHLEGASEAERIEQLVEWLEFGGQKLDLAALIA